MLVARRFIIRGRVQNVGFRWFAADAARTEGLTGWVQNRRDGAVEAVAEGDEESVRRFEARLRRGPASARVERVDVLEDVPSGSPHGFTIRE